MNINDLLKLVDGRLITSQGNLKRQIKGAFAADLMSDVLASIQPDAVLLTGLCNPQVVRTAHMADVAAIILVRGKRAPQETIELSQAEEIPIISSPYGMYDACGRLVSAGIPSLEQPMELHDSDGPPQ